MLPCGNTRDGAVSLAREGVRFAYQEMTQPKVICIRRTTMQNSKHQTFATRPRPTTVGPT
jgi:hypothetical protein